MLKTLKRLAASFLIAALLVSTVSLTSAEAAVKKPTNCHFVKWTSSSFTACQISWKKASGIDSDDQYQVRWSLPSGKNMVTGKLSSSYTSAEIYGLSNKYIYKVNVRVVKRSGTTITGYSAWSNTAWIVPLPTSISGKITSQSKRYVKLTWNAIRGAAGYKVYIATSENGKYRLQKTISGVTNTSLTIKKYNGSKLKKNQKYFVHIVPINKRNNKNITVPVPSGYYYCFWIY